jgi:hypothetical protein
METSPQTGIYFLAAIFIYGGLKGLITGEVQFGNGIEFSTFWLEGIEARLTGAIFVVAGVSVLFSVFFGITVAIFGSVLAVWLNFKK